MTKYISVVLVALLFSSCDFILKHTEEQFNAEKTPDLGTAKEKDENGCVLEAGYKWSKIHKSCKRVVEEGYRLNPIDSLDNLEASKSAFVLLDDSKLKAEVFLPNANESIYFERKNDQLDFINKSYKLSIKSGYILYLNEVTIYKAAKTVNKAVVGSDEVE